MGKRSLALRRSNALSSDASNHFVNRQSTNHQRWLVSYADFMTLLFGFFVMLYAVDRAGGVSEQVKVKIQQHLSNALGQGHNAVLAHPSAGERRIERVNPKPHPDQDQTTLPKGRWASPSKNASKGIPREDFQKIASVIHSRLKSKDIFEGIVVSQVAQSVELKIGSEMLFSTGSAKLTDDATFMVESLAKQLRDQTVEIRVQGHTDDRPIATSQYPSNWELSAARAASVVRVFADMGIPGERLQAIGLAAHRPVGDNKAAPGRQLNRRVLVLLRPIDDLNPGI